MEVKEKIKTMRAFHSKCAGKRFAVKKTCKRNNNPCDESMNAELKNVCGYDLVSALSHEFRTPLNVILSTIQMAQRSPGSKETGYCRIKDKYLNIMKQNCFRLMKMLNNLIDINRIDSDFFQIDQTNENIVEVIREITQSVSEYAQAKSIHVSFESNKEEHTMACDTFQLERILLNLLSNAVKFTPFEGEIGVKLAVMNEKVYTYVSDSGPGIPEKYQHSIFERFSQTDGKSYMEKKGSGMGLFLVKKLLEKMNGEIWLSSKNGDGSTFVFSLPNRKLPQMVQEKKRKEYDSNKVEYLNIEFSDIYVN